MGAPPESEAWPVTDGEQSDDQLQMAPATRLRAGRGVPGARMRAARCRSACPEASGAPPGLAFVQSRLRHNRDMGEAEGARSLSILWSAWS